MKEFPNKVIQKWNIKINDNIPDEEWNQIFNLAFTLTDDTKLQNFQFKLLHRLIYSNIVLLRMNLIESALCSFCSADIETLEHLFWECPVVNRMWMDFKNIIEENSNKHIPFLCKTFLFGILNLEDRCINLCILILKYYVYKCRNAHKLPNILGGLAEIEYFKLIDMKSLHLYSQIKARREENKWADIAMTLEQHI